MGGFFYVAVLLATTGYGITFALFAVTLEQAGASPTAIGLQASLPAIGWLLATPFVPALMRYASLRRLAMMGLSGAALMLIPMATTDVALWPPLRLVFGGLMGMALRIAEIWITLQAPKARRGRIIGIYDLCFVGGIIVGSLLQPLLGLGAAAFAGAMLPIALGAVALSRAACRYDRTAPRAVSLALIPAVLKAAPLAVLGVVAFAMFEEIPANLLPVYALKIGFDEDAAALTLTMGALGFLLGGVTLGALSDRLGRVRCLTLVTGVGVLGAALLPMLDGMVFLLALVPWCMAAEGLFVLSLALLADLFDRAELIGANVVYGMLYAAGALVGPVFLGGMMQVWMPHGLFVAAALIFLILPMGQAFGRVRYDQSSRS